MRLFLKEGEARASLISGPGDLAGRCGLLLIEGSPSPEEASRWAVSLGLFVGRGGEVRRLK